LENIKYIIMNYEDYGSKAKKRYDFVKSRLDIKGPTKPGDLMSKAQTMGSFKKKTKVLPKAINSKVKPGPEIDYKAANVGGPRLKFNK